VFLQETWLSDDELHILASLDDRFYGQGISAMDAGCQVLRGRPHGGLAILWRKTLSGCKVVKMPTRRLMSLHIDNRQHSMNLINVYMPCDHTDNLDEFLELLSYLRTAIDESDAPYVSMIGDFNANTLATNALFANELRRYCRDESLSISDTSFCPADTFTFFSEAHQSVSWLDHCVCNTNMHSALKAISALYGYVTSDHVPLLVLIDLSKATINLERNEGQESGGKIKWNKLSKDDISHYHDNTEQHLQKINFNHNLMLCDNAKCQDQAHLQAIDTMYSSIINALKTSGDEFLQQRHERGNYNVVPGWNDYCREVHANARDAFLLWTNNGRPRSGPLLRNMQCTRASFKQALRHCRNSESKAHADSLARKLLLKDTKTFWAEVKKLNGKGASPLASTIDNATGQHDIAERWRAHYKEILNSNPLGRHHDRIIDVLQNATYVNEAITITEVTNAIADLKLGKACGLDALSAEHFRYACKRLIVLLSLCFNTMLLHCHVPKIFSDTVLVPILKDKNGNITDLDNYRPIAITSVASKIFEKIVLLRIQALLCTNANQFSYKPKHSTEMCVFTLKSIIDFYITASSPVYLCYIDSSKAFDRVNFWCLFSKLIDRNVPLILVRFFMVWYCSQEFVVRWGSYYSTPFTAGNGVRQGGILSPFFFNLYMDELSNVLNNANVGCTMNGVTFNHLMYADDLVVMAPSLRAMQILLKYCDNFAYENYVKYNVKKTVCMVIRPKEFKSDFIPHLELSGSVLKCVYSHKYLGVFITNDLKDDINIMHQCRSTYSRGNIIIRNFRLCNDDVKSQLFRSYCTSFYCASLWSSYNLESLQRLNVAYNRIFRILMGLQHRVSISAHLLKLSLSPLKVIIRKLICSFRNRIMHSENVLLRTIVNSVYFMFSSVTKKWNSSILLLKQ
jgi:endonuclease/exonuclease/phosphatase family metal-dependent hydrolase